MSIDPINTNISALDPSNHTLADDQDRLRALAELAFRNQSARALEDATIVTVSDAVLAERRAEEDQASSIVTQSSNASAEADAARNDAATKEARLAELDAQALRDDLTDSDRENLRLEADFIKAELLRVADAADAAGAPSRASTSGADPLLEPLHVSVLA